MSGAPFPATLRRLLAGEALSESETQAFVGQVMDGELTAAQAAALLTAMAARGERVTELVGAARAMRERSLHVDHALPVVVDVCGTGGDNQNTINISTLVAFVVAAAGVPVAKHGNRAASSTCGSADVLEHSGVKVEMSPGRAAQMLTDLNFAFLFAPSFHPAMRNVAGIRRELGIRTLFNVLGPLTNPARATHQVVGVAREEYLELVGDTLRALGTEAGVVIHGSGVDEVAGDRPTIVYAFNRERAQRWMLDPSVYGIEVPLSELRGGSTDACGDAFSRVLQGERTGRADVVALNAGLAFHVCGKVADVADGLEIARSILASGSAYALFERVRAASHE